MIFCQIDHTDLLIVPRLEPNFSKNIMIHNAPLVLHAQPKALVSPPTCPTRRHKHQSFRIYYFPSTNSCPPHHQLIDHPPIYSNPYESSQSDIPSAAKRLLFPWVTRGHHLTPPPSSCSIHLVPTANQIVGAKSATYRKLVSRDHRHHTSLYTLVKFLEAHKPIFAPTR